MKAKVFFLSVLASFSLFSFTGNLTIKAQKNSNEVIPCNSDEKTPITEDGNLVLLVEDIKSFRIFRNYTVYSIPDNLYVFGGEIEFTNLSAHEVLIAPIIYYNKVFFFLDGELLFDPPIRLCLGSVRSNDLEMSIYQDKIHLIEGYQAWVWMPDEEREPRLKEQEENSIMRRKQLEVFIKYLSDNDKIIGNETAIDPPALLELNDISIYPNPTSGEFRVSGFEFRVGGIEVFNIYGIKQFSTFNFQFSTQIDISHLPAGIYFVRITTEKGVVTKKIVKK